VLNEFRPPHGDMVVILDHGEDNPAEQISLGALLPHAFGPHELFEAERG
jgi:hypothetical protein